MHELSLMADLVTTIEQSAGGRRIARVRLEIGSLTAVVPDALRFCFDVCSHGTVLEGASLEIVAVPGRARCRSCGGELDVDLLGTRCGCGSFELQILSGEELRLDEVEVA